MHPIMRRAKPALVLFFVVIGAPLLPDVPLSANAPVVDKPSAS
jgi:hypothetical protein